MSGVDDYELVRNPETGQFLCVRLRTDLKPIGKRDPAYQDFLAWNARREPPLDVGDYVFPPGHESFDEPTRLVKFCKDRGVMLCIERYPNGGIAVSPAYKADFPGKGTLYQLNEAAAGGEGQDGIQPRPSQFWVTLEMLKIILPREAFNPDSEVRRLSDWPIDRTFVYLDVSDFSKAPPGQEVLIINSLVRVVKDAALWGGQATGLPRHIEGQMCIGDGYIFVFRGTMDAVYFAAYLARLIDVLVGNRGQPMDEFLTTRWPPDPAAIAASRRLPVEFHFCMGVHCGPVYTFWDPGRNGWNYIGEGINGGNRVLSAMGKEYDDALYISAEVRHELMATAYLYPAREHILGHLHNRGRRLDKHGQPWRVYEVNYSAACSDDLLPSLRYGIGPRR